MLLWQKPTYLTPMGTGSSPCESRAGLQGGQWNFPSWNFPACLSTAAQEMLLWLLTQSRM